MSTRAPADLLIEIGTEELPPKALRRLSEAFTNAIIAGLKEGRLDAGGARSFASPRRLAVVVTDVGQAQEDRIVTQKGPPVSIGVGEDGKPSRAGLAFAKKCGAEFDALSRDKTDAGEWLVYSATEHGKTAAELLPEIMRFALDALPIPRRMRWGDGDSEFVRPVHWLILLHGDQVVPAEVLGIASGRSTRGHRFMSSGEIPISSPSVYADTLLSDGFVVADFAVRKSIISAAVDKAAAAVDGSAVGDESLIDEVTALTEWPVAVTGAFDKVFLDLPKEVIVQTLTSHQRYFPVTDGNGELMAKFITISNLRSKEPERVRDGNERVVRPRLADAAFFWETDQHSALESRTDALKKVVYQKGLGTLHEKSMRVAALASLLAEQVGADTEFVTRAAVLAKCDLLTGMVGEFPELQGVMGRYYATSSGEAPEVCQAIGDQYLPAFAGDVLPESVAGQILAVADRLDTLAGIFLLGKKPTGNRDPFGLRRAALGVVRILIEKDLDIDLSEAVVAAALQQPITTEDRNENRDALYDYIIERLRGYIVDADNGFTTDMFEAVKIRRPPSLVDFYARLVAVSHFVDLDAANGLAAANKRTANILHKAKLADGVADNLVVNFALLQDDVERDLFHALQSAQNDVVPLIKARAYSDALRRLSELRAPIDAFFDGVMVMVDDDALQRNRLALLVELRALFLGVADISSLTPRE